LLESILQSAGLDAAVFGTIEYRGPGYRHPADRTTPEAPDLQALLKATADAGCAHAVMEVSSHALALGRVGALRFDTAVFTNLSRDHLDLHGDMRSYFLEKKKLFVGLDGNPPRVAVLNRDDPNFAELAAAGAARVVAYGIENAADVHPKRFRLDAGGIEAEFSTPEGAIEIRSVLSGRTNLYNVGAAVGAALALGLPVEAIGRGIGRLKCVPGRFEPSDRGQDFRATEVIGGQYLDLRLTDGDGRGATGSDASRPGRAGAGGADDLARHVALLKSARYTVTRPLQLGAALGDPGRAAGLDAALTAYGDAVGLAFQLRDDVLGLFGDPAVTGKSRLDDLRAGKHTLLVVRALDVAPAAGRRVLAGALGDPGLDDAAAERCRDVVASSGALASVEALIAARQDQALRAVRSVAEPARSALEALAALATDRDR
jgi:hypothetical protein